MLDKCPPHIAKKKASEKQAKANDPYFHKKEQGHAFERKVHREIKARNKDYYWIHGQWYSTNRVALVKYTKPKTFHQSDIFGYPINPTSKTGRKRIVLIECKLTMDKSVFVHATEQILRYEEILKHLYKNADVRKFVIFKNIRGNFDEKIHFHDYPVFNTIKNSKKEPIKLIHTP